MPARPCGVYVSVADLRKAVSGTPDVPSEVADRILGLMDQCWAGQDTVDVMPMAERFWLWRHEITDGGKDQVKDFIFEAIMMRVKDDNLVPTVGMRSDTKH